MFFTVSLFFVVGFLFSSTYYYCFVKWKKGILGFLSLCWTIKKSIIWIEALLHKIPVNLAQLFFVLATEIILTVSHFEEILFLIYFKFF